MSKIAADLSSRPFSIARANVPRRAVSVLRGARSALAPGGRRAASAADPFARPLALKDFAAHQAAPFLRLGIVIIIVGVHFAHLVHMANICGKSMAIGGRERGAEKAGTRQHLAINSEFASPGPSESERKSPMFGGPVMDQFVAINSAVAVFWGALAPAFTVGLEGLSILLFAVFMEILWIDLSAARRCRHSQRRD